MIEQAGPLDAVLIPIGVGPMLADDTARSFASGTRERVSNPQTIADGTRTEALGELNFQLVMRYVDDIVTVREQAIMNAVAFLFYRTKLVVEPSGALGVAALIDGIVRHTGRVGVVLSGGNIDGTTLTGILDAAQDVSR